MKIQVHLYEKINGAWVHCGYATADKVEGAIESGRSWVFSPGRRASFNLPITDNIECHQVTIEHNPF